MDGESIVFYGAYQKPTDDWQSAIERITESRWEFFSTLETELDLQFSIYGAPSSSLWMLAHNKSLRAACISCAEVVPLHYVEESPSWRVHLLTFAEAAGLPISERDLGWWLTTNVASW